MNLKNCVELGKEPRKHIKRSRSESKRSNTKSSKEFPQNNEINWKVDQYDSQHHKSPKRKVLPEKQKRMARHKKSNENKNKYFKHLK